MLATLAAFALFIFSAPHAAAAPFVRPIDHPAGAGSDAYRQTAPSDFLPQQQTDNAACLGCHSNSELVKELPDGNDLGLYVDEVEHSKSVHGESGITCVQCHTDIQGFPHPEFSPANRRDASLLLVGVCQTCHADQYEKANDSVHSRALAAGNREAAVCTDCHTAHTVRRLTNPATQQLLPEARIWVPETCARCHSAIYNKYKESVHGAALIQANNLDVPTCIDCHGVHNIGDPTTAAFRLNSPSICARCHTDASIMDRYGISTQVLSTYVADFHGSTVTLFEKLSPDAETNKPVCFDCHGVHDIKSVTDPEKGLQVRENILARCQVCHPSANTNFSEAWLSHYIPTQEKYPLVYFVNVFYQLFIPGVLGGMAVLIALDISWRVRQRLRKPKPATPPADMHPALQDKSIDFEAIESSRPATTPTVDQEPTEDDKGQEGGHG